MAHGIAPTAILERDPKNCEVDGVYLLKDDVDTDAFVVLCRVKGEWFAMARVSKVGFHNFPTGSTVLGPLK